MEKRKNKSTPRPAEKIVRTGNPNRWYYLTIIVFSFILYGNTISNHYCMDDNLVVQNNQQVMKGFKAIPEIFSSHYREDARNEYGYRPIAKVTFAIESQFFKQNPHVSHFINILLYIILLLLLFRLLNKIFPDISSIVKFLIILLFAAHPIHTEVVDSLKNREELLCFIFAVAATLSFIGVYINKQRRWLAVVKGLFFLALSILSKQTGLIFCIMIPLILFQFYFNASDFRKIILPENRKRYLKFLIPFFVSVLLGYVVSTYTKYDKIAMALFYVVIPATLIVLLLRSKNQFKKIEADHKKILWRSVFMALFSLGIIIAGYLFYKVPDVILPAENKILNGFENPLFVNPSLMNKISLCFMSLFYYFKLIIIPFPLSFYYGYNEIPLTGLGDIRVIFSMIIYVFLFCLSLFLFYKNKIISFGILIYLIGLAMFANFYLPIPGIIGERLLFISSFGFCLLLGGIMLEVQKRREKARSGDSSRIIYFITAIVILIYSVETIGRNNDWKNHLTLYKADISHLEKSAKANSLYADELMRMEYEKISKNKPVTKSNINLALKHYLLTLEVDSVYPSVYNNIGTIYFMFYQKYDSALYYFEKSSVLDSLSGETDYNLAVTYDKTGDTIKALKYYEKAAKVDSTNIQLISSWANLLYKKGDLDGAIEVNMMIPKINPKSDLPYITIGNYYGALKDTATAVTYWEKAIEVSPVNDKLNAFLAGYFKKKGDEKKYQLYNQKMGKK